MKKTRRQKLKDYIKASRKGSRQAELQDSHGFVSRSKVHKSKKLYSRKNYRVRV